MQIQVILKDGETICGIFSTKSYAPVKDDCDDLFIETYTNSKFKKIENTGGIYISSDQIKEIIVVRKE